MAAAAAAAAASSNSAHTPSTSTSQPNSVMDSTTPNLTSSDSSDPSSLNLENVQLITPIHPDQSTGETSCSLPSAYNKELHPAPSCWIQFQNKSGSTDQSKQALLTNFLKCCLCNSLLKEPVTLDCGWSCCRQCFDKSHQPIFCNWISPATARQPCYSKEGKESKGRDVMLSKVLVWLECLGGAETNKESKSAPPSPSLSSHKRKRPQSFDENPTVFEATDPTTSQIVQVAKGEKETEARSKSLPPSSDYVPLGLAAEDEEVQNLLDCQVCFNVLYNPFTCPCGHTYCRDCLLRCMDHQPSCPVCRAKLPSFENLARSQALGRIVPLLLPETYQVRRQSILQQQREQENITPIFVCGVVFPGQSCPMHVFEPRYRLMLRRCVQSGRRRFGMCAPIPAPSEAPATDAPRYSAIGTWLEFSKVEWLPDGRALVDTIGKGRFKVKSRSMLDGYNLAEVEQVQDAPLHTDEERAQVQRLCRKIRSFISTIRQQAGERLLQQIEENFGVEPDDDSEFSFWAAAVLPVAESDKLEALADLSLHTRLARIDAWIDYIKQEWWFVRGACSIM